MKTINHVDKAISFLKKSKVPVYTSHVVPMTEYAERFRNKDKTYLTTKVNRIVSKESSTGEPVLGTSLKDEVKKTIPISVAAVGEITNIMLNEQTHLKASESQTVKVSPKQVSRTISALEEHYRKHKLWARIEQCLSDVLGIGAVGIVIDYDGFYNYRHTFYTGPNILPLEIIDDTIVSAAFVGADAMDSDITCITLCIRNLSKEIKRTKKIDVPNTEKVVDSGYTVQTIRIKDGELVSDTEEVIPVRPFVILTPHNKTTNDEYTNALGYPIYWNFRVLAEEVDNDFNLMIRDKRLSKRIISLTAELLRNADGTYTVPADLDEALLVVGNNVGNSSDTDVILKDTSPALQFQQYFQSMMNNIQLFGKLCGLGTNTLSIDQLLGQTATAIVSMNSALHNTMVKHYNQMSTEFVVMHQAMAYFISKVTGDKDINYNLQVEYSSADSVIEDTGTLVSRARDDVNANLMSPEYYVKNIRGLSGQEYEEEIALLKQSSVLLSEPPVGNITD